ncbi:MAG: hypothetical protein KAT48_01410 [Bacteroidales bacterium]|nr:hypothetical protein [Bacteroidales bacterium]
MRIVVNDTNVLIDLAQVNLLDQFVKLNFDIRTTDLVINEITDPEQKAVIDILISHEYMVVASFDASELTEISAKRVAINGLSMADTSAWYYAKKEKALLFTGDGLLRKTAQQDRVEVRGILFILECMIEENIISPRTAADKLTDIINNGAWLPVGACNERINRWRAL